MLKEFDRDTPTIPVSRYLKKDSQDPVSRLISGSYDSEKTVG